MHVLQRVMQWCVWHAGITKLDDANHAGGRNSGACTLILTEGDSAKSLAISGLGVVGRDSYGVFPLRWVIRHRARTNRSPACQERHTPIWVAGSRAFIWTFTKLACTPFPLPRVHAACWLRDPCARPLLCLQG